MLSRARSVPKEVQGLFEALVRSPDPVFATDRHLNMIFWNLSCERLFGFSEEEIVGTSCAGALGGCDTYGNRYCSEHCQVTEMAARGETIRHFGLRLRAKDGSTIPTDVSVLHLAVRPPDHFVLAHILKPTRLSGPLLPGSVADAPRDMPPRPTLVAVRESPDARARKLTTREVEVLGMLAAGRSTPEIGGRLHISILTARNHIQNILEKLEVHSKAEAVAFAFQQRLV
ncbi:MAG TPA: LuxR C-terminal-related transcriptional regulator [Thermoanaerobaculia bacterium]